MTRIALVQQKCSEDIRTNQQRGMAAVKKAAGAGAKIICFAELAFEPFYPQYRASDSLHKLAEPVPGPTTEKFAQLAMELNVIIILNLYELDGERTFDTSPVINRDGRLLGKTRMIHITDYEFFYEKGYYHPGDTGVPVYLTDYGCIGVAICYDRHYPEYMRAMAMKGAEIVFVPQAGSIGEWPDGLYEAEMRVASFQNGYYTALCNRVGSEEHLTFAGESFVCDPQGNVIARAGSEREEILYADCDVDKVQKSHARRLFFRDRRPKLYSDWFQHE